MEIALLLGMKIEMSVSFEGQFSCSLAIGIKVQ
jgi:hypothetical protein